jgi:regulator of protease activity HflC (stomatin/prohibitin superfamily)
MGTLIFMSLVAVLGLVGLLLLVRPPKFEVDDAGDRYTEASTKSFTKWVRVSGAVVLALSLLIIIPSSIKSIDATDVGVPITLGQPGDPLGPGPHLTLPWTTVSSLDVKTQVLNMDDDNEIKTVTSDRVQTPVDVSVYFSVDKARAATLLLTVGEDYVDKIVRPLTRSTVYDKGSTYSADNIQTQRDAYEDSVKAALLPILAARGIILEKIEIRKIQLPDAILQNAQAKINSEEIQKRTKIDAETKVIEATAQAKANEILADSIKQNKDVCQLLLVQGLSTGKITGPLYVNPCGTDSGTSPLLTKSVG